MATPFKGFKSHGIREPLTNRIAGILDEYPDGTQIARELLQNSDDAKSTVQWYLLDHRDHGCNQAGEPGLFDEGLREYMGPALLAGSDSVFEEKDFTSMKNLAHSEKKNDETKIGQMGIGFNSIYHMTDCPSFISGDQLMIIEPHERIFNGKKSPDLNEGAVRGSFVENNVGLEHFPNQLRTFSVLEDIDFTQPYPGTIFRFPLRTQAQAEISDLSKNAYPAEKAREMLAKLKSEALRGILFLKYIERIEIYEIKEGQDQPSKIFQIEIVNAEEVRSKRQHLLQNLRAHVYPDPSSSRDAILEYSVRPVFKLTQEDGTVTQETWHITTMVGNVLTAHEYMAGETDGDLRNHKLIPWVGIGAPAEPGTKIDISRLFCFLPIGIQLPFPVHVNGHFAVKQSRREIWTNQDNDFARHASAYIKSVWNVHLFKSHIPVVYAKFLDALGLSRGPGYDLWPVSCGEGLGLDAIWKDLLKDTLRVMCKNNLPVFFCKSCETGKYLMVDYKSSWIAGRDIDKYPLLLDTLQKLFDVVTGLPDPVLKTLPEVVESLDLENRILTPALIRNLLREQKGRWIDVSSKTKVEMLKYCIQDDEIADLKGLPLLPLAGDQWVEFSVDESRDRFYVTERMFKVLSYSNDGVVNLEIDDELVETFHEKLDEFKDYWSSIKTSVVASRIKDVYSRLCYRLGSRSTDVIGQQEDQFPTKDWIKDFWDMFQKLAPNSKTLMLSLLEGIHLLPLTQERLAPLSKDLPVVYLNRTKKEKEPILVDFLDLLEIQLGCRVLQSDVDITETVAKGYVFEVSNAVKVLQVLAKVEKDKLDDLNPDLRKVVCGYMERWLPVDTELDQVGLKTLKSLPIYRLYDDSTLVSLQDPETGLTSPKWRVALRFRSADNPWLPTSFDLLAYEQPMSQHLTTMIGIKTIKESEYWYQILSNLDEHDEDEWDPMMETFCSMYHHHLKESKERNFVSILQDFPFVPTIGPPQSKQWESERRLDPRSIVNPSLSPYYMNHEKVFPAGIYSKEPILGVLAELGMRSKFDSAFIQDRLSTLPYRLPRHDSGINGIVGDDDNDSTEDNSYLDERSETLHALYGRMNADFTAEFSSQKMLDILHSTPWILAKSHSNDEQRLCTVRECRPRSDSALIGVQMPTSTFDFHNEYLIDCMGWDQPPPLDKVLSHFLTVINRRQSGAVMGEEARAIFEIYSYLHEKVDNPSDLKAMKEALAKKHWILVNETLHPVDRVALQLTCELAPHFVEATTSDTKSKGLFKAMGVREIVGQDDLQSLISTVTNRYNVGCTITVADSDFVVKLLQGMTHPDIDFEWTEDLLVPTVDHRLCKTKNVVFNDVGLTDMSTIEEISSYNFANGKITKPMAERLKVPMLSTTYWIHQSDLKFNPWPEERDLLGAIGDILGDYSPSNIFKEFLEIAIVSGATKCSFLLDRASHPRHKTICPEMATWQGPALVIYNDAELSEDDLTALCSFEAGDQDSNSSIGCQGYNFSSVYHFTDVPSIVSGSYIGFLDPRQEYLPMKNTSAESSQRCKLSKLMNGILSDQLAPYLDLFDGEIKSHFNGTIIRIPLRTLEAQEQSGLERVIGQVWTIGQIQAMFRTWVEDAKVGMLFSKKLATIEIKDNIRGNADFGWCATKTVGSGSAQLDNMLNEQSHERGVPSTTQIVDIHVTTSGSTETESWKWLVHTEHELPQDAPQEAKVIEQRYQVDVDRGIAIPLDFHFKGATFRGRMLTRAPTSIPSGLPFHVFAHLSVTPTTEVDAENLAENHDEWNNFMIGWALPSTAINAFERLLQWMFRGVAQGGPKAKDITEVISHYFQLWPSKPSKPFKANDTQSKAAGTSSLLPETLPSQDPIDTFIRRFIRESFHRPVFLCRSPIKPLFKILKGVDVIFSGLDLKQKDTPEGVEELIRHRLRYLDFKVCDCPDNLQAWIEHDWGLHPALAYRQIDPDLIRELIRQDPTFTTDSFNSIERKCWILDYTMKALLDPVKIAAMKEPLVGLTLIPLVNGEWEELQPEGPLSQPYYTAEPVMRELISGADILVDVGLFNTFKDPRHPGQSTLEKILNRLVEDPTYCIRKMTPREFGAFICQENPQGISNPLRDKIWRLLDSYDDLEPFGDLHVLKTLDGATKPLRCVLQGQGLEISLVHDTEVKQGVRGLSSLLKDLGVVVVDATHNNRHRYFTTRLPRAERGAVLSAIGNRYGNFWPSNRILTMDEVIILRDMLDNTDDDEINQFAAKLGQLQLWESWESSPADGPNPPLIRAHGSYFVEGTRLSCWGALGTNSDLIRHTNHAYFKAMGAKPLSLIRAVQTRVIPQFLDGSLSCTGATKDAYIETFNEIIRLTTLSGHNLTEAAHNLLRNENFILARDGSFQSSKELFDPDDHLCAAILGDTPSKFPDQSVWDLIGPNDRGHLFSFRNSQDPDVVIECANYVLDLTQGSTELSQDLVYSKAITIVDFIYRNGDETNWMDPKWKIVPAEVASQSPYSGRVPNLPAYLSFKDLVDPGLRLQVWTQCAFFPKDLAPPLNFRQRFPSVGVPSMEMIVEHLNVLVTELAHTWKLLEQEEALRSALLDVYRALDDHAAKSRMDVARLLQDTFNGVPYIFEGHGALPSNPGSWFEPSQLLRGLSQDMDYYYKVPDELKELSWFLEAAGVQKMQNVNSRVNVVKERGVKDIENWLLESFQDQDQKSGFMDVKFIFADGQQISAHKVLLVRMSEHFMTRLTGAWSECEPLLSLTEINMSNQVEYEVFYGLLYYFYTDRLIPTNGPSVLPQSTGDSGVNVRNSNSPELLDRVQYLMDLLHLSDEYRTSRLTTLIVQEIVTANKVTHDNVFDVRAHAEDMLDCRDLLEHCNEYLRQNESTLQAQLEKEMESLQDGDGSLTDEQSEQLKELEDKQEILTGLLNTHV